MKILSIGTLAATLGAAGALLSSPMVSARDHVNWSVNVGVPGGAYPAYSGYPAYAAYPAPVYNAPQVIYAQPQPVYVEAAPVYYSAPNVYIAPVPVYRPEYYGYYGHPRHWNHGYYGHPGYRYYGR